MNTFIGNMLRLDTVIQESKKPYFYLRTAQGFKEKELILHFVEDMPFGMFNFSDEDGNLMLVSAHALTTARRRVDETQSQHFDFNDYPHLPYAEQLRFLDFIGRIDDERNLRKTKERPCMNYGLGTVKLIFEIFETIRQKRSLMVESYQSMSENEIYDLKYASYLIQMNSNPIRLEGLGEEEAIQSQNIKFNMRTESGYYFVLTFIEDDFDNVSLLTVYLKDDDEPRNTIRID